TVIFTASPSLEGTLLAVLAGECRLASIDGMPDARERDAPLSRLHEQHDDQYQPRHGRHAKQQGRHELHESGGQIHRNARVEKGGRSPDSESHSGQPGQSDQDGRGAPDDEPDLGVLAQL
ncbi:MAG: hypothetical protein JWQ12_2415, partial [Glaciihabitans sp.]|nr:hypothetical protein [Glaciihabitans sp.]